MRFSNFYSVKDEICIDFKSANINTKNTKELSDNTFKVNDESLLKILGFFGPNASGKTSILKAAAFCKQLVIDSHMNNEGSTFTFIPFKFDNYSVKFNKLNLIKFCYSKYNQFINFFIIVLVF